MKLISHRGNITGPNLARENSEEFINEAIDKGFDCEVDVWLVDDVLYLGHDAPTYKTSTHFLKRQQIWAHAKNYQALEFMLKHGIHCFWHENDARVLTSRGFVWTYPGKETFATSIIVVLDKDLVIENKNIYGVCGDYVETWKTENSSLF